MQIRFRDLPATLQPALRAIGLSGGDVDVQPAEAVPAQYPALHGHSRGVTCVVSLVTGEHRARYGSWGGANPFEARAVDHSAEVISIPVDGAVIQGDVGHGRPYLHVYVHPSAVAKLLPAAPDVTDRDREILSIIRGYIPAARKEYLARAKVQPAEMEALVSRGLLKRSKVGAISITTEGKNALSGCRGPSGLTYR